MGMDCVLAFILAAVDVKAIGSAPFPIPSPTQPVTRIRISLGWKSFAVLWTGMYRGHLSSSPRLGAIGICQLSH